MRVLLLISLLLVSTVATAMPCRYELDAATQTQIKNKLELVMSLEGQAAKKEAFAAKILEVLDKRVSEKTAEAFLSEFLRWPVSVTRMVFLKSGIFRLQSDNEHYLSQAESIVKSALNSPERKVHSHLIDPGQRRDDGAALADLAADSVDMMNGDPKLSSSPVLQRQKYLTVLQLAGYNVQNSRIDELLLKVRSENIDETLLPFDVKSSLEIAWLGRFARGLSAMPENPMANLGKIAFVDLQRLAAADKMIAEKGWNSYYGEIGFEKVIAAAKDLLERLPPLRKAVADNPNHSVVAEFLSRHNI